MGASWPRTAAEVFGSRGFGGERLLKVAREGTLQPRVRVSESNMRIEERA